MKIKLNPISVEQYNKQLYKRGTEKPEEILDVCKNFISSFTSSSNDVLEERYTRVIDRMA